MLFRSVLDENNAAGTRSPSTDLLYCLRWHENEVIELEKMIGEEVDNNFMVNNLKAKVERHKSFVDRKSVV